VSVCHTLRFYQNGVNWGHEIFTIGNLKDSSFRIRKAFPEIRSGSPRSKARNEREVGNICDFRGDSVEMGPQMTVGWSEPEIFRNFGRHIFGTFTAETNIIMRRHEMPYWLSSNSEMLDLE